MKPRIFAHKYHAACNLQGVCRSGILSCKPRASLRVRCLKGDGCQLPVEHPAAPHGPAEPPPFPRPRFEDRTAASSSSSEDNPAFDDLVLDEALYRELGITPDELDAQKAGGRSLRPLTQCGHAVKPVTHATTACKRVAAMKQPLALLTRFEFPGWTPQLPLPLPSFSHRYLLAGPRSL